jgi:hypothetical protein
VHPYTQHSCKLLQVALPVAEEDSLAAKIEALRIFLERELGTETFLKLYHHLESLSPDDDAFSAADTLCSMVGDDKVHFIPLVHQLITSEEVMHASGHS